VARERTGNGQYLETSLFESALALSVWETAEYWATGEAPQPLGTAHRLNAPYQVFRTRDGHIALAALSDQQWQQLCRVVDRPALATDARFASNGARMANRPALTRELEMALAGRTTAEWVERLLAAGVPTGPLLDYDQVMNDPHTHARQMIEEVDNPVAGTVRTLGFPVKMTGTPLRVRRPPPSLGEHNAELRRELGLEPAVP
jgi:formyl-CoA transferase